MRRIDFNELKTKVGIDDIAYSLGYRLDKTAGVGRYIEMILKDNNGMKKDTIIIKNPKIKEQQKFWRRNGSSLPKDVIGLIRENLHSFNVSGINEWDIVSKVLLKFANEPLPETSKGEYLQKAGYSENKTFDEKRYETKPIEPFSVILFHQRAINKETVDTFSPFLVTIKDKQSEQNFMNLGFPYTEPGNSKIVGYEIRGFNGFKMKAAGTNSSTGAWIADFSHGNTNNVKNVFFAESGFDIMAFYQINKEKINKENSVFVSIGGTFSDKQITGIMNHYSEARAIDCFDNDLPGRLYGIRMAGLLEETPFNIIRTGDKINIKNDKQQYSFDANKICLTEVIKQFKLRYKVGQNKAPEIFKDWNDMAMNKPITDVKVNTKFQRDENLAEKRNSLKI